ncbi:MAG: hypothetical protein AB3N33_09970 [Puniceicoccaceae bacterium]
MTPISLRALWKGLRGRSLVFSIVFAMAVMGSSFAGLMRAPLRTIGIWGPLVFILPIVATALLDKQEAKLKLEPEFKRLCSYSLIFGSILLTLLLWNYREWQENAYADSVIKGPLFKEQGPDLPRGPRGKR